MEPIKLKLTDKNSLSFGIKITSDEPVNSRPKARIVCEGKNLSYIFNGQFEGDQLHVSIPSMKGILTEGNYKAKLELLIEDKYFTPLSFELSFVDPVKLQIENKIKITKKKEAPVATLKEVNNIKLLSLKEKYK